MTDHRDETVFKVTTMLDLVAGLLIVFFAWKGFRRGLASALMDFLGLLAGMGAAYLWMDALGEGILARFPELGLLAYLSASIALFFAVFVVFQVPSWFLGRRSRRRQSEGRGSAVSAWSGAILNGLVGFVYVLGLLWMSMLWIGPGFGTDVNAPFRTPLQRLSGAAMGAVARQTVHDEAHGGGLWRSLAETYSRDPGSATVHLKTVMEHPDVQAVLGGADLDETAWYGAQRMTRREHLVADAAFMNACTQLGMWSQRAPADVRQMLLEQHLQDIKAQLDRIREMPQMRALLSDPEFLRMAQERRVGALLRDPRLVQLWQALRDGVPAQDEVEAKATNSEPEPPDAGPTTPAEGKMYRWRDAQGRTYITDEPPPEGAEEF